MGVDLYPGQERKSEAAPSYSIIACIRLAAYIRVISKRKGRGDEPVIMVSVTVPEQRKGHSKTRHDSAREPCSE